MRRIISYKEGGEDRSPEIADTGSDCYISEKCCARSTTSTAFSPVTASFELAILETAAMAIINIINANTANARNAAKNVLKKLFIPGYL